MIASENIRGRGRRGIWNIVLKEPIGDVGKHDIAEKRGE